MDGGFISMVREWSPRQKNGHACRCASGLSPFRARRGSTIQWPTPPRSLGRSAAAASRQVPAAAALLGPVHFIWRAGAGGERGAREAQAGSFTVQHSGAPLGSLVGRCPRDTTHRRRRTCKRTTHKHKPRQRGRRRRPSLWWGYLYRRGRRNNPLRYLRNSGLLPNGDTSRFSGIFAFTRGTLHDLDVLYFL